MKRQGVDNLTSSVRRPPVGARWKPGLGCLTARTVPDGMIAPGQPPMQGHRLVRDSGSGLKARDEGQPFFVLPFLFRATPGGHGNAVPGVFLGEKASGTALPRTGRVSPGAAYAWGFRK